VRAAVTREPNVMELADVPDAPEPGPGEALLRPEAVGLCGSDYHFLTGDIVTTTVHGPQFPKIQGHEVSAVIERLGPDAPPHLREGQRVAIWPLRGCGECYACSIGRSNVCPNFSLIGIHVDGALADRITLPVAQLFPVGDLEPAVTAFVEPISIAVHAVNRGRVAAGERVVIMGAGPIGQALSIACRERGASVLLVDLVASRLELGRLTGADVLDASGVDDIVGEARAWSGGEGPQVVFDAVGLPAVIRDAVDLVVSAGRVVIVGISHHQVELEINAFTAKEIDVLGTSVCTADAFAEAAEIVGRNADVVSKLISRRFPLDRAPEAIAWAMANPQDALKVVVEAPDRG
jgi:threonine dehydrogenase-like Zn-dependent dehydrogenase